MKSFIDKFVNSRVGSRLDKFFNSPFYAGTVGIICIICHTFNIPILGVFLLTLLVTPAFLFCKNSFVIAPIMLLGGFVISHETKPGAGYYNTPLRIAALCIFAVIVAAAMIFNLIYYGKWRIMFKRAYLSASIFFIIAALLLGGFNTEWYSVNGVIMTLAIAFTMLFPYVFMFNCGEYNGRKTTEYITWIMIAASVVISAAVIKQYVLHWEGDGANIKSFLTFGYAISNSAAAIVVLAIPLTFYMIYTYKHGYLFFIAVAVQLATIILTLSRASSLVAIAGTLVLCVALCFKKKNGRLGYYISFGILAVCSIVVFTVYRQAILELFEGDITMSGRTLLWKSGFEVWCKYPIFGSGIWYLPQVNMGSYYHSYHCTPLTFLYCCGIVGLVMYIYHRYKTVRLAFSAKLTPERVFVMLTVLALLINSLLDIYMTEPLHLMYYSYLLALIESDVKKVKSEAEAPSENVIASGMRKIEPTTVG